MFTKNEFREERLRLRDDICRQLWSLRKKSNLTIRDVAIRSKMPMDRVESLELFGLANIHMNDLQLLAKFYNKYVKISLVNKEEL